MRTFTEMQEAQKELHKVKGVVEKFLNKETEYNFASRCGSGKPESVFQEDLIKCIPSKYPVESPLSIKTSKQNIRHELNEDELRYDINIKVGGYERCLIELKYDEEKSDGTSTNPQSEDEVIRDIYKLQIWKDKHFNDKCIIVFATNHASHWENFTSITSGVHEITYNGKQEKFSLSYPYTIQWKESESNNKYKYCIIEVEILRSKK